MLGKTTNKLRLIVSVTWHALCSGSTRSFYDRISSIYEYVFTGHIVHVENIVTLLTSVYPDEEKCLVLDLGSGTGLLSKALSRQGFRVIAMDISMKSLQVLQHSDRRVLSIQGDAESFPLTGNSFQVLVCLGVWRHLPFPEVVLDEICRVLSEDGNIFLGYFPPKLGGLIRISDNRRGRMLACLYNSVVRWFGYDDLVDFDLTEKTLQIIVKRFEQVRKVASGRHWHLLLAHHPLPRLSSIDPPSDRAGLSNDKYNVGLFP